MLAEVPTRLIGRESSTGKLVNIATETLNQGLRPDLTRWHARFRSWYSHRSDQLKMKTPQELQKEFPEFEILMADMLNVNKRLIQYAGELQKIFTRKKR